MVGEVEQILAIIATGYIGQTIMVDADNVLPIKGLVPVFFK